MTIDHLGELLVGLESLPLQRCAPVFEEPPRPLAPELTEGLLEQVGGVQSLVRCPSYKNPKNYPHNFPKSQEIKKPVVPAIGFLQATSGVLR
jgi:hypothetical protein